MASIASPPLLGGLLHGQRSRAQLPISASALRMSDGAVLILAGGAVALVATVLVIRRLLFGRWGPAPSAPDPGPSQSPGPEAGAWAVGLVGLEASLSLAVLTVVHELGHAAVSEVVGLGTDQLQVGPLALRRGPRGFRVEWRPIPIVGVLGFHSPAPSDADQVGKRLAAVAVGGPVASLLAGAGLLAMTPASAAPGFFVPGFVTCLPRVAGWTSIVLGAASLLPRRLPGGLRTDGALIVASLGKAAPAIQLVARLRARCREGRRPREWGIDPLDLLAAATVDRDLGAHLAHLASSVALDTGQVELAAGILADLDRRPDLPPFVRTDVVLQGIMLDAFSGRATEASQRFLDWKSPVAHDGYGSLARAVLSAAGGRPEEAGEALASWERYLAGSDNPVERRLGNEWAEDRLRALLDRGR